MIGVVVVTHGQLATELVNAAETIVGDLPQFAAVSIGWHDDVDDAREEIRQAIARVQGGRAEIVEPPRCRTRHARARPERDLDRVRPAQGRDEDAGIMRSSNFERRTTNGTREAANVATRSREKRCVRQCGDVTAGRGSSVLRFSSFSSSFAVRRS
jgi:hypothetical protein